MVPERSLPGPAERRRLLEGLRQPTPEAARFLLGKLLVRRRGAVTTAVRIVEVEAYLGQKDPAAHAYRGRTARTEPIWGPPGTLYVYFIYGMHYCLNVAVEPEGEPGCVLIRAAEPAGGSGAPLAIDACRGPGRLCRSLGLDTRHSGRHVFDPEAGLTLREGRPPRSIEVTTRIGIRAAADRPLRFFDGSSLAVSGPRGPRATAPVRPPRRTR